MHASSMQMVISTLSGGADGGERAMREQNEKEAVYGEPQLPQCSVCNATMQRRGDSLRCIVCEEGWTTEQPTGEPKHCSELLDTGVISELHDAIQEAKGESAGLAERGEPQVTVHIVPQWVVRFTYWDGITTSDGFQCDSPEEAQQHIDRLVKKNLVRAADPAQGQPKLECWNCHKDIPEDERDLVCCSDCSSQWREIANAKRAAQGQMSAREWLDKHVPLQFTGSDDEAPGTCHIDKEGMVQLMEAFARSRGERPHVGECNYQTQPIGSPGCLCVVVNRNELRRIMAAPSLPSDLKTWLINFLEGCSYLTPQSSLDEVRNDAKRLLAALSSDKHSVCNHKYPIACSNCGATGEQIVQDAIKGMSGDKVSKEVSDNANQG